MAIIKLRQCYLKNTDIMGDACLRSPWLKWVSKSIYVNSKYIIRFEERKKALYDLQKYTTNKENFNTIMYVETVKDPYYIKETSEQIMELIGESNDK